MYTGLDLITSPVLNLQFRWPEPQSTEHRCPSRLPKKTAFAAITGEENTHPSVLNFHLSAGGPGIGSASIGGFVKSTSISAVSRASRSATSASVSIPARTSLLNKDNSSVADRWYFFMRSRSLMPFCTSVTASWPLIGCLFMGISRFLDSAIQVHYSGFNLMSKKASGSDQILRTYVT